MSIRKNCPCDIDGGCPYDATYNCDCEYWCGADEPEDYPEVKTDKQIEKDTIYLIIEDAIEEVFKYEPNISCLDIDEIVRDLEHIQNCLAKGVYDKED